MIIERMQSLQTEMKQLRQFETEKKNRALREQNVLKIKACFSQLHTISIIAMYLQANCGLKISTTFKSITTATLATIRNLLIQKPTDPEVIKKINTDIKQVEDIIRKDWKLQYQNLTGNTIDSLSIISKIEGAEVSQCLSRIRQGQNFSQEISNYEQMRKGLDEANGLISELNLDAEIRTFLTKMNNGQATIMDLNSKVLSWIQTQSLGQRIRLSFSVKNM